ncbi:MAG: hypothetical protein NXI03_00400 [Alphaproteobacteria bacterium]|uniref:hypothetical protein n=1 Tax=Maricaulis alexandrii TaxID=2570354 RepID=UPI001107EF1C|nr:hypothetical protein [Maricaulis alexandrii]MCR9266010.1 hypothetical protein [Alphaproteobacteria bacterium]
MANALISSDTDNPNVLHALIRKRAEIAGKIEHNQQELRNLVSELDAVDATLRIFDPDIDVCDIDAKPVPPRHQAFRGEVTRIVHSVLRKADNYVTSTEIALVMMEKRNLPIEDRSLITLMTKRVSACLTKMRKNGQVEKKILETGRAGWKSVHR